MQDFISVLEGESCVSLHVLTNSRDKNLMVLRRTTGHQFNSLVFNVCTLRVTGEVASIEEMTGNVLTRSYLDFLRVALCVETLARE